MNYHKRKVKLLTHIINYCNRAAGIGNDFNKLVCNNTELSDIDYTLLENDRTHIKNQLELITDELIKISRLEQMEKNRNAKKAGK